jgi:hypothetical protein
MKIGHSIGRCLPKQIQFKRESAYLAVQSKSCYVTLGKLCQSCGVAKGSSKPEAAHCQNRYPSPNEWSDHTRVRPLTPFWGGTGQEHASFDPLSMHSPSTIVVVWETIPCDISSKVAHHVSSGVKTSGVKICSTLSKFSAFWASWQPFRPVRALASNAHPWVPSVVHWPLRFLTQTSLAARLSAVWLGQPATKPVCAPTNLRLITILRAVRACCPGGPFSFAGAV